MVERKHVFIDKPVQTRYMMLIAIALVLTAAVTWASFCLGIWDGVAKAIDDDQLCEEVFQSGQPLALKSKNKEANIVYAGLNSFFKLVGGKGDLPYSHQKVFTLLLHESFFRFLPIFLGFLFFICWMSILYTHRFVGPFYRIFKDLEVIANGRLNKRIALRRKDEGQEVADAINHTIARIDLNISMLKKVVREHGNDLPRLKTELNEVLSKFITSMDANPETPSNRDEV